MAGSNQLSLEILIKTIADNRGIATTNDQVKELAANLRNAAAAGDDVTTSGEEIARALQGTGKAATESAKGTDIFARALEKVEKQGSGVTDQMREQAQQAVRNIEVNEKTAQSAESVAKNLNGAKLAFSGVRDVVSGGLNGNLLQVGEGFLKISKAANDVGPKLQSLFAQIARGSAAGAAIGAPLIIATKAMEMYAADLEKANKRILDSARDTSEQRKKIMADETAAIVADYAKQVAAADRAATAAEEAQKRTEAAYARAAKKTDASREQRDANLDIEEKNALGSARTDADRERIKRDFARRRGSNQAQDKLSDFNTSDYQGQVHANEAQRAIDDASARNRDAQAGVGQAEIDYQNKQSAALSYKATDTSAAAVSARKAALDARDRVATLKGEAGKVETETSKTIQVNQAIIDQAKDTKEIVAIEREILKATLAQQSKEARKAGDSESKKDASSIDKVIKGDTPTAPEKPGNILGEITKDGKTVVVNRDASGGTGITRNGERVITDKRTIAAIGEAQQTMETVLTVFGQFAGAVTDKGQKLATNLQNERERSGGG